jgi:hypothetical protein
MIKITDIKQHSPAARVKSAKVITYPAIACLISHSARTKMMIRLSC